MSSVGPEGGERGEPMKIIIPLAKAIITHPSELSTGGRSRVGGVGCNRARRADAGERPKAVPWRYTPPVFGVPSPGCMDVVAAEPES